MFGKFLSRSATTVATVALLATASTALEVVTVPIGNPRNLGKLSGTSAGGNGPDRICGAVDYDYNIGTYEVSNAEYAEFLNSVATVGDPHGVYNADMGGGWNDIGGISRSGSGTAGDPWAYSIRLNRGNRPVNYVSYWDACRFANWLHNGQPTGMQNLSTTEDGAYFLNGVTTPPDNNIQRESDWRWAVTSEDEWYKAAYYDGGSGVYYDYPAGGNLPLQSEWPPGTDMVLGSANYAGASTPFVPTDCGAYDAMPSDSPYGTFDQGGNVWEWNESVLLGSYRGLRGGSFHNSLAGSMFAAHRISQTFSVWELFDGGFRVVSNSGSGSTADFDEDGDVDGDDFLIWQAGFNVDDRGDANGDGDTDGNDFLIWQTQFGSGSGTISAIVPEPASVVLLLAALACTVSSRRLTSVQRISEMLD